MISYVMNWFTSVLDNVMIYHILDHCCIIIFRPGTMCKRESSAALKNEMLEQVCSHRSGLLGLNKLYTFLTDGAR